MPCDKKLTKPQQKAVAAIRSILDALSLKDASAISSVVSQLADAKEAEWLRSEEYQQELDREAKEYRRRSEDRVKFQRQVAVWAVDNIRPGDIVKMSGTRDGHGIREVELVQENAHGEWYVQCRAFERTRSEDGGNKDLGDIPSIALFKPRWTFVWRRRPEITTHSPGKVAAVLRDGKMVPVRLVMQCNKQKKPVDSSTSKGVQCALPFDNKRSTQ